MNPSLDEHLAGTLRGTSLEPAWNAHATPLLERWGGDRRWAMLDDGVARGLLRVVASSAEAAGFLARRSALFPRLAELDAGYLARRGTELANGLLQTSSAEGRDLESALDALRLRRREETLLAACLDLGGTADFEAVSVFLSQLAEGIVRDALQLAQGPTPEAPVAVVGMGKIGGREFTYHSDLDLVFLYEGEPEQVTSAARACQRLIAYLSTMTGAGIAYAVDARLRPSGQQGTLVTSLDAFERYQREEARTWEHLVLMRARVLAGAEARTRECLARTQQAVVAATPSPWSEVGSMRARVERERSRHEEGRLELKTGPGGLMDIDFLAEGAVLERGGPLPPMPSVPALLRQVVKGPRVERLLESYRFLRRVEARARWLAGRAIDSLRVDHPQIPLLAELVDPGAGVEAVIERLREELRVARAAFCAVLEGGSIGFLGG